MNASIKTQRDQLFRNIFITNIFPPFLNITETTKSKINKKSKTKMASVECTVQKTKTINLQQTT